jgi:hypothetical protein
MLAFARNVRANAPSSMADEHTPSAPSSDSSEASRSQGGINAMVILFNAVAAGLSSVYATTRSIVVTALVTGLVVVLGLGLMAGRKWPR